MSNCISRSAGRGQLSISAIRRLEKSALLLPHFQIRAAFSGSLHAGNTRFQVLFDVSRAPPDESVLASFALGPNMREQVLASSSRTEDVAD